MSSGIETIRIGTRGSELALRQARSVARAISDLDGAPDLEEVIISTSGDRITDVPLSRVSGRSFFTKEIEEALLDGTVDVAVHSLKDLATLLPDGLTIGAIIPREDPRDVLISREGHDLDDLPDGARIGTSSLRRRAFMSRTRPDIELVELRGNVPTRLKRLQEGEFDAIVVAAAGVKRLDMEESITAWLPPDMFPPAPGQGAIAIQCRTGDEDILRWVRPLDHIPTHRMVTAERALLRQLGGGCQVPVGAFTLLDDGIIELTAAISSPDGERVVEGCRRAPVEFAEELGMELADELLQKGGREILDEIRDLSEERPLAGKRVVVTRPNIPDDMLTARLENLGATILHWPMFTIHEPQDPRPLRDALNNLDRYDWIIFSSARSVDATFDFEDLLPSSCPADLQVGAVGRATATVITARGWPVHLVPDTFSGESLVDLFRERSLPRDTRILFPASAIARESVPEGLRELGTKVDQVIAYEVGPTALDTGTCLTDMESGGIDAITFASPSAVSGLMDLFGSEQFDILLKETVTAVIGATTAQALEEVGYTPDAVADPSTLEGLAGAVVGPLITVSDTVNEVSDTVNEHERERSES